MNRHERRHGGLQLLDPPSGGHIIQPPRDPRLERVKVVAVPPQFLLATFTVRGKVELSWRGMEAIEGAAVVNIGLSPEGHYLIFLHRADYPIVLAGQNPPLVEVGYDCFRLDEAGNRLPQTPEEGC